MRLRGEGGFTLLEVVLVVALLAVALAISYPSLSRGTAALQLRSAGRDVLNALRLAREKSITEQTVTCIVADAENRKVSLTDEFGEGGRAYALPRGVRIARLSLAGQVVTGTPLVIRFLPNGSAENGEITLASDSGAILRVVMDPITGGAHLMPGAGDSLP